MGLGRRLPRQRLARIILAAFVLAGLSAVDVVVHQSAATALPRGRRPISM